MNNFMSKAIYEAKIGLNKNHGGPFGAVIVKNGKIISKGHNEVLSSFDPTAHAEIKAIRKASKKLKRFDLSDCEIYTTCEPCPMCLSAIYWARIKKIYFGCTKKDASKIGFIDDNLYQILKGKKKKTINLKQIDRNECLKPFKDWEEKKDKIIY